MEPAESEALSFWPALNLPTSIVPSRRVRERSQAQSRGVKRFKPAGVVAVGPADERPTTSGTGSAKPE